MSKPSAGISFIARKGKRKKLDPIAGAFDTNLSSVVNDALGQYIDLRMAIGPYSKRGSRPPGKASLPQTNKPLNFSGNTASLREGSLDPAGS